MRCAAAHESQHHTTADDIAEFNRAARDVSDDTSMMLDV